MDDDTLHEELRSIREKLTELTVEVAILKNTRALAWKWGTGAGAAISAAVAIAHALWGMM